MNIAPTVSFEIIHLDNFKMEKQKFLTIIDSFSKNAQSYEIKSSTPTEVFRSLFKRKTLKLFTSYWTLLRYILQINGEV